MGVFLRTAHLPSVLLIEYGLIFIIWTIFAFVWIFSIYYNTWTRPLGLSVAYGIVSKSFIFIGVQRWKKYGLLDQRSILIFFVVALHALNYVFSAIEFHISRKVRNSGRLLIDNSLDGEIDDEEEEGDEKANFFSRLFFCWANKLIKKGYNGNVKQVDDLFRLPSSLQILRVEHEFLESAPTEFTDAQPFSFASALFRAFGFGYFCLGLLCFIGDSLKFAGPILLHLLITSFEKKDNDENGYLYATMMLFSAFFSSLCNFNFNFYVNKVSLKVRCALLIAVYDKLLQIPSCRLSQFSSGQLINFMSTDVDRVVGFVTSFHAVWSMPMNLIIALYLLYREVGFAFLAGLVSALITVPVNKLIAKKIGDMSAKMMHYKDQRMRLVTESMNAIRVVKLNNWEPFFAQKIGEIRARELHYLKRRKYLDAICVYLWASAPILITVSILGTYTLLLNEQLTAAKVFTSLALVNILILPLNAFPWVLNSVIEAGVSKRRFDKFFAIKNADPFAVYALTDAPGNLLQVNEAMFSWPGGRFSVKNVSVNGFEGSIIGIIGPVGCGKSTILMGILGETEFADSKIVRIRQTAITEGFSYVGQDCWLRRGTLRENILCGSPYDAMFYRQVLRATALEHDIEQMPGGDAYVIGNDGSTLSGGQRARVALARAVYQDCEVFLLDDPFASLDRKVADFIYEHCVCDMLKARGKLVVICTHHVHYLREADRIIRISVNGGRVECEGAPAEVLGDELSATTADIMTSAEASLVGKPFDNAEHVEQPATLDEAKEDGTVRIGVYCSYLNATGYTLAALICASLMAMQISKNASDVWLSKWTINTTSSSTMFGEKETLRFNELLTYLLGEREARPFAGNDGEYARAKYFLTIYMAVAVVNSAFTLMRAFLFAHGGVVAAERLHHRLLRKVLSSTVAWWDETPWGRVVNRLCSDVYTVDDALPFQLNICLASLVNLMGALLITAIALPFLLPLIVALLAIYYFIQRYYRFANCEVKRITSVTLSPLYNHITDTVNGLVTIRAHRFGERFIRILRDRFDSNLRAQYAALAASQWLSVRLQLLGVVMVSAIAYTGIAETRYFHVETGLVALAITYALSLTNTLSSLLTSFIDTEKELISVERVADFIENVPNEATNPFAENLDKFLFCRALSGQIDFTCVSMRYGSNLPWALKNVTFRVEAGQRVGIIGRTGAGKSSVFQALLRAYPIETGKIFIDGGTIDISQMDPRAVRSMFGFVSQVPFIFSGTIRDNLVVSNTSCSDASIISLLSMAKLEAWLNRCGGLDAEVTEGGRNLSFGEKQIICLCRMILSSPKIVLIDEATAHMDVDTHLMMNNLIRTILPDTTVISIVHRTIGLEEFDWIIELSNGTIHRQGPPSAFHNLSATVISD